MLLSDLPCGKKFLVEEIRADASEVFSIEDFNQLQRRMYHLGIIEGSVGKILRIPALKGAPLLLEFRHSVIALSFREANWIRFRLLEEVAP